MVFLKIDADELITTVSDLSTRFNFLLWRLNGCEITQVVCPRVNIEWLSMSLLDDIY